MKRLLLFGLLFTTASASALADGDSAGLARHAFADRLFFAPLTQKGKKPLSVVRVGSIDVPETGDYVFTADGSELDVFDGRFERETDNPQPVRLEKGRHRLVRWSVARSRQKLEPTLSWRRPGAAQAEKVPASAFSHTADDVACTNFFENCLPMTLEADDPELLQFRVTVREAGLYQLCLRRRGDFRWGCYSPETRVGIWLDGVHRREQHCAPAEGGFRHDERLCFYLTAGEHVLEFRGQSADKYLKFGTRLWWCRPEAALRPDAAFELSQEPEGESVFRCGDRIRWRVRADTSYAKAPRTLTMEAVVQRTSNVVWRAEGTLKPGQSLAEAFFDFVCDREGAFEYVLKDETGAVLEGPWQMLVVDTRKKASAKLRAPVKVDAVDLAQEGTGGVHQVRDDGTSAVIVSGALGYRRSGGRRGRNMYQNVGPKDPGLPERLPPNTSWSDLKKAKGATASFETANWFGFTLHTDHPKTTHLAVFTLPADVFRRFPIQLIDTVTGASNGASVEIPPQGPEETVTVAIPVWPNGRAIDVLMIPSSTHNDTRQTESAVAKVELYWYPDGLPPLAEAADGWDPSRLAGWRGEQGDLSPERTSMPPLWDDPERLGAHARKSASPFMDFTAFDAAWRRYAEYAAYIGCNWLCWPIHSYGMAHIRTKRMSSGGPLFTGVKGFRDIDRYRRNTLKVILLLCEKYGIDFYGDTMITPNIPKEMARSKLTMQEIYDGKGNPVNVSFLHAVVRYCGIRDLKELEGAFLEEDNRLGGNFNPVHPVGRRWLADFYGEIAEACKDYPAFKGMNLRQWNACATAMSAWWASPLAGYDDYTLDVYRRETGAEVSLAADRKARQDFLLDDPVRRERWFRWRSEKVAALQKAILAEMRRYRADLKLQVYFHHGTGTGPWQFQGMGADESLMGRENGYNLAQALIGVQGNECNQLDPYDFFGFDVRPGVGKEQPKGREYFAAGTSFYPVGLCTAQGLVTGPDTTKNFARAMAERPLEIAEHGMFWAYPADMQPLREWLRAYRAIPQGDYRRVLGDADEGYVALASGRTVYFDNLTRGEQTIRLAEKVRDRVTGETTDTIRLAPWGLAVVETADGRPPALKREESSKTLRLRVSNPYGTDAARGVLAVVSMARLRALGGVEDELRLYRGERELPVQVDGGEELAFLADFAKGERTADLRLALRGGKRPAFPSTLSVSETNGVFTVRDGGFEVDLRGTGFVRLSLDGADAYRPDKKRPGLLWWVPSDPLTKTNLVARPLHVLSCGPVRALVGYDFGPARDVDTVQFRTGKTFPAYRDLSMRRIWQVRAGSRTLEGINRLRYTRSHVATWEYQQWWENSWCDPYKPMEEKRTYALDGRGRFTESRFVPRPEENRRGWDIGGSFEPLEVSDRFAYWNGARGMAFMLDRSQSMHGGFTFKRGLAAKMCEMHVPPKGGFDMRFAVRALGERPTEATYAAETRLPAEAQVEILSE